MLRNSNHFYKPKYIDGQMLYSKDETKGKGGLKSCFLATPGGNKSENKKLVTSQKEAGSQVHIKNVLSNSAYTHNKYCAGP